MIVPPFNDGTIITMLNAAHNVGSYFITSCNAYRNGKLSAKPLKSENERSLGHYKRSSVRANVTCWLSTEKIFVPGRATFAKSHVPVGTRTQSSN
jgi:hypothetical protein